MTAGPSEISPRTLRAMSAQTTYPWTSEFIDFYQDTEKKLAQILQTRNDIVIMHGECVLGLEAAIASTLNPGDKALVLDSGPFGKGMGAWIKMYGGEPVYLSVEYNDAIDPADVKKKLDEEKDAKLLTVVHSETPAGTINPIKEICRTANKRGLLTIVDAASSLGGMDIRPEEWGIDICVGAAQKCLSGPPLSVMSVSKNAWQTMENKRNPLRFSYLSILDWKENWIKKRRFPYAPLVSDIYGINEAATEVLEEGMQKVFNRHKSVANATRTGIQRMGLKLWPKRTEIAADTLTAVTVPKGINDQKVIDLMLERYGILIGRSLFELEGKAMLIAHMGYNATLANAAATLAALEWTLSDLGYRRS
jgi:aspartate aminotransferase-like enzyme